MASGQLSTVLWHIHQMVNTPRAAEQTDGQLLERFVERRDEAAFGVLVRRHGPMVLGVCRRVLRNVHDAEDAFQATFLILARKASAIGKPAALPGWLHEVARRTALRARANAASRRMHERRVSQMPQTDFIADVAWRDLQPVLDEEVGRLPETCRVPFVLCYLEGHTYERAAEQLHCLPGTITRRLARARDLLRLRLPRRGLALPAGVLAAALSQRAAAAGLATPLAASTIKAALFGAAGKAAAASVISMRAAELVDGGLRAMALTKTKLIVLLLAVGLLGASAGVLGRQTLADGAGAASPEACRVPAAERKGAPAAPGDAERAAQTMTVTGRVLDTAGKPIAKAHVAVMGRLKYTHRAGNGVIVPAPLAQGRAYNDGRFRLTVPRTSKERFLDTFAQALAEGHGLGLAEFDADAPRPELTIWLPAEQVVVGRLVDLQGLAAPGVNVQVARLGGGPFKEKRQHVWFGQAPSGLMAWPGPATTNADGRFTLRGVPREASITLQMDGDRFAVQELVVNPDEQQRVVLEHAKRARLGQTTPVIEVKNPMQGQPLEFMWSLKPAHIVEGAITYADTGEPVPESRVVCFVSHGVFSLTYDSRKDYRADAKGRFHIVAEPGDHFILVAYPVANTPYLLQIVRFTWPGANIPKHRVDVKLPRGVLVSGTVTERSSGKPVAGASVEYVPGPNAGRAGDGAIGPLDDLKQIAITVADGTFALPVLAGKGSLLVNGPTLDYLRAETTERKLSRAKDGGHRLYPNALIALDLKTEAQSHEVAVTIRRGITVRGRVLAPDGKPATDVRIFYRSYIPRGYSTEPMRTLDAREGRFTVPGLDPDRPEKVYFLDFKGQRAAVVPLPGKQGGDPLTVRLEPCGTAIFRPVDKNGKPVPGFQPVVELLVTPGATGWDAMIKGEVAADYAWMGNLDRERYRALKPDEQGRVTLPTLLPGATYRLHGQLPEQGIRDLNRTFTVRPGQMLDLGDVPMPMPNAD
jgi:RNA polymerase sigma factor (sigma-70 family)